MKKQIAISIIAFFAFIQINAQAIQRGMYVDNFYTVNVNSLAVPAWTILGDQTKENTLLSYAQTHNFTYLALYDLEKIFDPTINAANGGDLQNLLAAFIAKAKSTYGVQEIGAVGQFVMPRTIFHYNWGFDPSIICTLGGIDPKKPLPMLEQPDEKKWSPTIAYTNFNSNVYNFNLEFANKPGGRYNGPAKIDVVSIEWEFWGLPQGYAAAEGAREWKIITNNMQCLNLSAPTPTIIETEMGLLDPLNLYYLPQYTEQDIANIIDNSADRILLVSYTDNIAGLEPRDESSLLLYDNNAKPTIFCPLFSAEAPSFTCNSTYQTCPWNSFLGTWLLTNSLTAAETQYNSDFSGFTTNCQKSFFMWFTYSNLNANGVGTINRMGKPSDYESELSIKPISGNPINKSTTITFLLPNNYSNASIELRDINGRQILKDNVTGKEYGTYTLDASSIESGIYFCKLLSDGKESKTQKLIVVH